MTSPLATSFDDMHRVCNCGWATTGSSGVGVRVTGGQAGLSGAQTCGSVWACPNCAVKVAAGRAQELGAVLGWARTEKHTLAMVTLTVSHKKGDPLKNVWDAVSTGWESVASGSSWVSETEEAFTTRLAAWHTKGEDHDRVKQDRFTDPGITVPRAPRGWHQGKEPKRRIGDQEEYGLLGWARATEVTLGASGWHVHSHLVCVLDGNKNSAKRAAALGESMAARWNVGIGKKGFTSSEEHGVRVDVSQGAEKKLADYIAKGLDPANVVKASVEAAGRALAREATFGAMKKGRLKGRSPFQLLEDTRNGELEDIELWGEWVRGSFGRRQLTWSANLRNLAGLIEDEKTDEEIAAQELGTEADTVVVLPLETWHEVRSYAWKILDLAEQGTNALKKWLDSQGLAWDSPLSSPEPETG